MEANTSDAGSGARGAGAADISRGQAKQFWRSANVKFAQPHYRTKKCARIVNKLARNMPEAALLDVGCGPAALKQLLKPRIQYFGIDIAIQEPAPYLVEADLVREPVEFGTQRFDFVVAQGVFEYLGDAQERKFREIAGILTDTGRFLVSYWNFAHRNTYVYSAFSNIQPIGEFRTSLSRYFDIDRSFPASHNWRHSAPYRPLPAAISSCINVNIPLISPVLAVEYFFLCSPKRVY
jgi:SAM-dependent methyltransferase